MREELISELANGWRYAENAYMDSDFADDSEKQKMWEKTGAAKLTLEEQQLLDDLCTGMGV